MVGADIAVIKAAVPRRDAAVRLKLDHLDQPAGNPFAVTIKGVSLEVHGGEVVAIAGVAGNGQSELFDALSGERQNHRVDAVVINGTPAGRLDVTARRRLGAAFVPEERLGHGAVPGFVLSENVVLTRHSADPGLVRNGFLDLAAAREVSQRVSKDYDVRKAKVDPEARALSGGNLQKFVVGRELDRRPSVLVINQPTWGVDAGASVVIRQALIDLARSGSAVLVISQDLDEIFEIADRVAVISRGELSPAHATARLSAEQIGLLMAGTHEKRESLREGGHRAAGA
jgi:simple sugar transport system ATP-binding protein